MAFLMAIFLLVQFEMPVASAQSRTDRSRTSQRRTINRDRSGSNRTQNDFESSDGSDKTHLNSEIYFGADKVFGWKNTLLILAGPSEIGQMGFAAKIKTGWNQGDAGGVGLSYMANEFTKVAFILGASDSTTSKTAFYYSAMIWLDKDFLSARMMLEPGHHNHEGSSYVMGKASLAFQLTQGFRIGGAYEIFHGPVNRYGPMVQGKIPFELPIVISLAYMTNHDKNYSWKVDVIMPLSIWGGGE